MKHLIFKFLALIIFGLLSSNSFSQSILDWKREWPNTNFDKNEVALSEIISGGPPKDGIPAIDTPEFLSASNIKDIGNNEPVIYLVNGSDVKAYPFRILMWHEIVNDMLGDIPVTVTYCPLCNAAVVFDRRINGKLLDFGVSGKLRHSDMIMYDRQTESWWQQFLGVSIVGEMTGVELKRLPARIVPFNEFRQLYPDGEVLISRDPMIRPYGENPYVNYDSASRPFLYKGRYEGPGSPMSYVIGVEQDAWLLTDVREIKKFSHNDLTIEWQVGMNSSLDTTKISDGRDIGYVTVSRKTPIGRVDVAFDMTFAFVFKAFYPEGIIHEF